MYDGGGGPDQPKLRTDLVISAYLPGTSEHLVVRINRAEAAMFLNKSTDWLSRMTCATVRHLCNICAHTGKKNSPIVKASNPFTNDRGENYVSRDLYLDVDRCVLSKTKVALPCIDDQENMVKIHFQNMLLSLLESNVLKQNNLQVLMSQRSMIPAAN